MTMEKFINKIKKAVNENDDLLSIYKMSLLMGIVIQIAIEQTSSKEEALTLLNHTIAEAVRAWNDAHLETELKKVHENG